MKTVEWKVDRDPSETNVWHLLVACKFLWFNFFSKIEVIWCEEKDLLRHVDEALQRHYTPRHRTVKQGTFTYE